MFTIRGLCRGLSILFIYKNLFFSLSLDLRFFFQIHVFWLRYSRFYWKMRIHLLNRWILIFTFVVLFHLQMHHMILVLVVVLIISSISWCHVCLWLIHINSLMLNFSSVWCNWVYIAICCGNPTSKHASLLILKVLGLGIFFCVLTYMLRHFWLYNFIHYRD